MYHSKSEKGKKIVEADDKITFEFSHNNSDKKLDQSKSKKSQTNSNFSNSVRKSNKNLIKKDSFGYKIGNYEIKQTLGEGTFGKVKLGIYIPTNEKVAIKVIEKDRMIDKDDVIRICEYIKKKTPGQQDLPLMPSRNQIIQDQEEQQKHNKPQCQKAHDPASFPVSFAYSLQSLPIANQKTGAQSWNASMLEPMDCSRPTAMIPSSA